MVQVDVFWAYGLGASLAAASGRKLSQAEKPFESLPFVQTVLFLSLIWAPTGLLLLLRHPSWETMQAASDLGSLPPWLVIAFGITNVTQGILGFWVGLRLLRSGKAWLVHLNWWFGYFGMFFILVYGWDGLGFDRFFYDRDLLPGSPAWSPGAGASVATLGASALRFLGSSVATTLYVDGAFLLPPFFYLMTRWRRESLLADGVPPDQLPGAPRLIATYLAAVLAFGLGSAIACAVGVSAVGTVVGARAGTAAHVASYLLALPACLGGLWWFALRPRALLQRALSPWCSDAA